MLFSQVLKWFLRCFKETAERRPRRRKFFYDFGSTVSDVHTIDWKMRKRLQQHAVKDIFIALTVAIFVFYYSYLITNLCYECWGMTIADLVVFRTTHPRI